MLDVPPSLLWSVKENFVSVQETPPRDQTIRESDTMVLLYFTMLSMLYHIVTGVAALTLYECCVGLVQQALQTPGLDNSPIPMEHDDGRDNQTHLEMCAELNIIDASPIPGVCVQLYMCSILCEACV